MTSFRKYTISPTPMRASWRTRLAAWLRARPAGALSCTLGLGAFALSLALVVRRTSDVMPASLTVSAWCDAALASVRAAGPSVCTLAVLAVATGIVACVRREPGQRLALFGAVCGVVALSIPLVVGLLALLIVGALVVAVLGA